MRGSAPNLLISVDLRSLRNIVFYIYKVKH